MFHVKLTLLLLLLTPIIGTCQHFSTSTIEVKPMPALPSRDQVIESYLFSFEEFTNLTPSAKEWFYWTNFSRTKPRAFWDSVVSPILQVFPNLKSSYSNSLRRDLYSVGVLEKVKPSASLREVAQLHANDLRKRNAPPSHTSPSGQTFQTRMTVGGINRCAGENISFGPSNVVLALIFLYIDEAIPDLGHRKALLSKDYSEMGIGISEYSNGNFMVIQDFACTQ